MRKCLPLIACLGFLFTCSTALQSVKPRASSRPVQADAKLVETSTGALGPNDSFFPLPVPSPKLSVQKVVINRKRSDTIQLIPERTLYQALIAVTAIVTSASHGITFNSVPVAESLVALACGVIATSGITAIVEQQMNDVPHFDPNAQRFDQSKFSGRFLKMLLGCDPRLLLYNDSEVRQFLAAVKDYKSIQDGTKETDRLLWEAKRVSDSALHPETEEWIPRAFRMSGYLPFNGPICVAMVAAPSTWTLLFWSWLNQSQNALVNYYNRSASSNLSNETLLKSYAAAVGSALLIAFGLCNLVQTHFSGEEAAVLERFISFPSAVIASSLNCFVVRSPEMDSGIPLLNENKENVLDGETSKIAAKRGVYATTASRAILQLPTFCIPPLVLQSLPPLQEYIRSNPTSEVPITTFLLLLSFGIGLPMVIGLLPQFSKIAVEDVEPKFANLEYKEFYYDKGL